MFIVIDMVVSERPSAAGVELMSGVLPDGCSSLQIDEVLLGLARDLQRSSSIFAGALWRIA